MVGVFLQAIRTEDVGGGDGVRIGRQYASGKPIKAIARDLRLSRKVVHKAVRKLITTLYAMRRNTAEWSPT